MRSFAVFLIALAMTAGCARATIAGNDDGGLDGTGQPDATDAAPSIDAIDASACATAPCDIYAQCGCEATPGAVCDLDGTMLAAGATACRQDLLHGDETLACTRDTSCAARHGCIGGRCRRYCMTDDDCPGEGGLCAIHPTFNSQQIPGVTNCSTDCVPTQATNPSCPPAWACHIFVDDPTPTVPDNGDDRFMSDCTAPGAGAVGAACTNNGSCAAGLDCISLNPGGNQCRPNCLCPGGNCAAGACPGGSGSCRGFTDPVVIGAATYGTCF